MACCGRGNSPRNVTPATVNAVVKLFETDSTVDLYYSGDLPSILYAAPSGAKYRTSKRTLTIYKSDKAFMLATGLFSETVPL